MIRFTFLVHTGRCGYFYAQWTHRGKLSSTPPSGQIHVGNVSNVATGVAPGGDVTMTNAGAFTVTKLQGSAVSATTPTTTGQAMRWNGSAWAPAFISMFDLRSIVTGSSAFGGGCTSGQTLTWTAATDNLTCGNISLAVAQITGTLPVANGGIGQSTLATGDILYASSTTALSRLPAGTNGQVLTLASGVPSWSAAGGGGALPAANGTVAVPTINFTNSTGMGLYRAGSDILGISTAGSERMRINANGNLGIGTTSPSQILDISSGAAWPGILIEGGTDGTGVNGLMLKNSTGYQYNVGVTGSTNLIPNNWVLFDNSASAFQMVVNSAGNVGIGTTSPDSLLTISPNSSDVSSQTALNVSRDVQPTADNYNGNFGIISNFTLSGSNNYSNGYFNGYSAYFADVIVNTSGNVNGVNGFVSTVYNLNGGTVNDTAGYYAYIEADSGTLTNTYGVLVDTPGIYGGSIVNSYGILIRDQSFGTNNFAILTQGSSPSSFGGSVGIGNSSPGATLEVSGHVANSGSGVPAVSSCGTSPPAVVRNDTRGVITYGTGTATKACTITFATAYGTAPYCTVSQYGAVTAGAVGVTSTSTTTMVLGWTTAVASAKFVYNGIQ